MVYTPPSSPPKQTLASVDDLSQVQLHPQEEGVSASTDAKPADSVEDAPKKDATSTKNLLFKDILRPSASSTTTAGGRGLTSSETGTSFQEKAEDWVRDESNTSKKHSVEEDIHKSSVQKVQAGVRSEEEDTKNKAEKEHAEDKGSELREETHSELEMSQRDEMERDEDKKNEKETDEYTKQTHQVKDPESDESRQKHTNPGYGDNAKNEPEMLQSKLKREKDEGEKVEDRETGENKDERTKETDEKPVKDAENEAQRFEKPKNDPEAEEKRREKDETERKTKKISRWDEEKKFLASPPRDQKESKTGGITGQMEEGKRGQEEEGKCGQVEEGKRGQVDEEKSGQVEEEKSGQVEEGKSGQVEEGKSGQEEEGKSGQEEEEKSGQVEEGKSGQGEEGKSGQVEDGKRGQVDEEKSGQVEEEKSGQVEEGKSGQVEEGKSGQEEEGKSGQEEEGKSGQVEGEKSGQVEDGESGQEEEEKSGQEEGEKSGQEEEEKSGQVEEEKSGQGEEGKSGQEEEGKSGQVEEGKSGQVEGKSGQVEEGKSGQEEEGKSGQVEEGKSGQEEEGKSGQVEEGKNEGWRSIITVSPRERRTPSKDNPILSSPSAKKGALAAAQLLLGDKKTQGKVSPSPTKSKTTVKLTAPISQLNFVSPSKEIDLTLPHTGTKSSGAVEIGSTPGKSKTTPENPKNDTDVASSYHVDERNQMSLYVDIKTSGAGKIGSTPGKSKTTSENTKNDTYMDPTSLFAEAKTSGVVRGTEPSAKQYKAIQKDLKKSTNIARWYMVGQAKGCRNPTLQDNRDPNPICPNWNQEWSDNFLVHYRFPLWDLNFDDIFEPDSFSYF